MTFEQQKSIYVAGASREIERIEGYIEKLERAEFKISFDWTRVVREVGSASPDDLGTRARAADDDLRGVHKADLFWLVMPEEGSTSTGAWVELGYALAKFPSRMMIHDCAILVSGRSRKCIFADLADHRFADHDEALAYIIGRWGRKS